MLKITGMRKRALIFVLILVSLSSISAKTPVYPVDGQIGQCVPSDYDEEHEFLSQALSEPYSFEWAEQYLHPKFKKNIALVYSSLLSEVLPVSSALYSRSSIGADGTYVIAVRLADSGKTVSFAVSEGYIAAILN